MSDLNLLPSQAKFQAEKIRIKGIVDNFLWIFSGLWVLLLVGVFLLELILNLTLKKFNSDYQKSLTQYQSMVENVALNQKIKYQAKVVAKVLADRFEYGKSMKLVKDIFQQDLAINTLEISDVNKFSVSGSVDSGENMYKLEEIVENANSGLIEGVNSIKLKDISVDKIKGWNFSLEVVLNE